MTNSMKVLQANDFVWIKQHRQFGQVTEIKDDKFMVKYTHDIWGKHEDRLEPYTQRELIKFNVSQFDIKSKSKSSRHKPKFKSTQINNNKLDEVLDLLD